MRCYDCLSSSLHLHIFVAFASIASSVRPDSKPNRSQTGALSLSHEHGQNDTKQISVGSESSFVDMSQRRDEQLHGNAMSQLDLALLNKPLGGGKDSPYSNLDLSTRSGWLGLVFCNFDQNNDKSLSFQEFTIEPYKNKGTKVDITYGFQMYMWPMLDAFSTDKVTLDQFTSNWQAAALALFMTMGAEMPKTKSRGSEDEAPRWFLKKNKVLAAREKITKGDKKAVRKNRLNLYPRELDLLRRRFLSSKKTATRGAVAAKSHEELDESEWRQFVFTVMLSRSWRTGIAGLMKIVPVAFFEEIYDNPAAELKSIEKNNPQALKRSSEGAKRRSQKKLADSLKGSGGKEQEINPTKLYDQLKEHKYIDIFMDTTTKADADTSPKGKPKKRKRPDPEESDDDA